MLQSSESLILPTRFDSPKGWWAAPRPQLCSAYSFPGRCARRSTPTMGAFLRAGCHSKAAGAPAGAGPGMCRIPEKRPLPRAGAAKEVDFFTGLDNTYVTGIRIFSWLGGPRKKEVWPNRGRCQGIPMQRASCISPQSSRPVPAGVRKQGMRMVREARQCLLNVYLECLEEQR